MCMMLDWKRGNKNSILDGKCVNQYTLLAL